MRQKYDFIFSTGSTCACSQALRHGGLQFASFPFDWLGGRDLRVKADRIREEFAGWFGRDTFELVTVPRYGHDTYWRDRWSFSPIHDLNTAQPLEAQLPPVRAKYERRTARLLRLIGASKRVLAVQVDDPLFAPTEPEDVRYFRDVLTRKWPGVRFDVLVLQDERGRALSDRRETSGEGWRVVTFDFRKYDEQPQGVTDFKMLGDWLASEFEVADYRTPEERRSAKSKQRMAKYAKFGATSWLGFVWNRTQYKLYKSLKKGLAKRGIV